MGVTNKFSNLAFNHLHNCRIIILAVLLYFEIVLPPSLAFRKLSRTNIPYQKNKRRKKETWFIIRTFCLNFKFSILWPLVLQWVYTFLNYYIGHQAKWTSGYWSTTIVFLYKYKNTNIETAYSNTIFVHQLKKKKKEKQRSVFLYYYSRFPAVQIVLNTTHVQKYIHLKFLTVSFL